MPPHPFKKESRERGGIRVSKGKKCHQMRTSPARHTLAISEDTFLPLTKLLPSHSRVKVFSGPTAESSLQVIMGAIDTVSARNQPCIGEGLACAWADLPASST
jgi:hypothetical protein